MGLGLILTCTLQANVTCLVNDMLTYRCSKLVRQTCLRLHLASEQINTLLNLFHTFALLFERSLKIQHPPNSFNVYTYRPVVPSHGC